MANARWGNPRVSRSPLAPGPASDQKQQQQQRTSQSPPVAIVAGGLRRASSRPISIIRSTSVPGQLHEATGTTQYGKFQDFNDDLSVVTSAAAAAAVAMGFSGARAVATPVLVAQSLPMPAAPLMGSSLPPSRFMDDMPLLHLGPQADAAEVPTICGSLSASLNTVGVMYASSCPATLWGFQRAAAIHHHGGGAGAGKPPSLAEEDEDEERPESFSPGSNRGAGSLTGLSVLEAIASSSSGPAMFLPPRDGRDFSEDSSAGDMGRMIGGYGGGEGGGRHTIGDRDAAGVGVNAGPDGEDGDGIDALNPPGGVFMLEELDVGGSMEGEADDAATAAADDEDEDDDDRGEEDGGGD
ncbi:unnamed protein product [Phaeothamnion confervicola]